MTNATTPKTPAAVSAEIALDTPTGGSSSNDSLRLTFANGQTLVLQVGDLSPAVLAQALMHGLKQKLVDAAAISRNPDTGRSASIADKYEAVKEVYDRLLSGQWNKTREGGGATGGLLFRALCRMYDGKKTPEALREFLDGKTDAEKAALRKNTKVAAIIETIRAESAKTDGVDADGLLDELND